MRYEANFSPKKGHSVFGLNDESHFVQNDYLSTV